MYSIPVLFLIFNRPDTTQKVLDAIGKIKPAVLYVVADAPRPGNVADEEKCRQTREVIERIDWDCSVKKLYRTQNMGSFLGVKGGIEWFFEHEEMGIILEDDCVPDKSFFLFCEEMLHKFKNNEKIISINGSNLGYVWENGNSYTFSRFMNMWGWATWRRSARKIDYELNDWKNEKTPLLTLYRRLRQHIFDTDINWYRYWRHKFDLTVNEKKISWWDWQWIYHQLKNKQLSVVPAVNLVTNIGFTTEATHTKAGDNPAADIPARELTFPLKHPSRVNVDLFYEEKYVKWVWCYHRRIGVLSHLVNSFKAFLSR